MKMQKMQSNRWLNKLTDIKTEVDDLLQDKQERYEARSLKWKEGEAGGITLAYIESLGLISNYLEQAIAEVEECERYDFNQAQIQEGKPCN